jgi:hypothetical protein
MRHLAFTTFCVVVAGLSNPCTWEPAPFELEGPLGSNGCPLNLPSPPIPRPPAPDDVQPGSAPSGPQPDADEVARAIARGYRNPSLSTVKLIEQRGDRNDVVHWRRQFDGADIVGTNAVTVWASGGWQTNWYPELHEPPPIHRAAMISDAQARASAGFDPTIKSTTRLVQVAVFKQLYKVPNPKNTMDVENVIDCYRPSVEVRKLDFGDDIAYVDAYTGDIVQRIAHPNWVN